MAVTSINSTRNGTGAIDYVLSPKTEGRERVRSMSGNNVIADGNWTRDQMRMTREAYGKNGINKKTGKEFVQAYRLKQSFSDEELDPDSDEDAEKCNEMGLELAKEVYPDHEVLVVTHSDGLGGKLHNHLIINAVSFETGKSLRGKETNWNYVSEKSDEILKANGLSVIENKKGRDKRTQAEIELAERGEYVWKDDLKERIRETLDDDKIVDKDSFIEHMKEEHEVNVRFRGRGMSYAFEDEDEKKRRIRSSRLGTNFQKENVEEILEENKNIVDLEPVATPKKSQKKSLYKDALKDFMESDIDEIRDKKEERQRAENERKQAEQAERARREERERLEQENKRKAEIKRKKEQQKEQKQKRIKQERLERERLEQERKREFIENDYEKVLEPDHYENLGYRYSYTMESLTEEQIVWYEEHKEELKREKEERDNAEQVVTQQDDYDLEL